MKRVFTRGGAALLVALALSAGVAAMAPLAAQAAAAAAAQPQQGPEVLRGHVMDGNGKPVAGLEVALHRVTEQGGAMITRDTSDAEGAFALRVPGESDPQAVFFVATRYQDELYIGQPFRAIPPGAEYVVTVGAGGVTANALAGAAAQGAAGSASAAAPAASGGIDTAVRWLLAGILGLVGVGVLVFAAMRWWADHRRRGRRELLIRVARLDESYADRVASLPAAEADSYRSERAALAGRIGAAR